MSYGTQLTVIGLFGGSDKGTKIDADVDVGARSDNGADSIFGVGV